MNVSLTPKLERFIREKVDSGRYQSSSEVAREALRLLLRSEIQKGIDSGEPVDGPTALDRLLARYEANGGRVREPMKRYRLRPEAEADLESHRRGPRNMPGNRIMCG